MRFEPGTDRTRYANISSPDRKGPFLANCSERQFTCNAPKNQSNDQTQIHRDPMFLSLPIITEAKHISREAKQEMPFPVDLFYAYSGLI